MIQYLSCSFFEEKIMSLNLLTNPKFHFDLAEALKIVTIDDINALNEKIDSNLLDLPDEIITLVKDSELFKKLLVLTQKAFVSNDTEVANGVRQFFFEMAEQRLRRQ